MQDQKAPSGLQHRHAHCEGAEVEEEGTVAGRRGDVVYVCPMYPQVVQNHPGNFPVYGTALEPDLATTETKLRRELVDMRRRLRVGLALSIPVVALEMGGHLVDLHILLAPQSSNWLQLVFATPVVLWAGAPFFGRPWRSIVTKHLNMFTLIAMGTGVAWVYSVIATVSPGLFSATYRFADGAVAVYFVAAVVVAVNIRQNLLFAFLYNAVGVPVAGGGLYPVFGPSLSPYHCGGGNGALIRQYHREFAETQRYANRC